MNFDVEAKEWDTITRRERAKIISAEIKSNLLNEENKTVLEFGCGTGLISFNLNEYFKALTLVDNCKEMIEVVDDKIESLCLSNMKGICCDLSSFDILEEYDAIYTSMALHHVVDIDKIICTFYEMLNNKGKVCIVDLNEEDGSFHKNEANFKGHNGFSQNWLQSILKKIGFNNIKSYTFYQGIRKLDKEDIEYSLFIMVGEK